MRWGWYALLLVVALILQTTLVPVLTGGWLDLFLVIALWVGLRADPLDARLAAFAAGLAQSLETAGPFGAHAFALGLTGWLLTLMIDSLNVRAWLPRFVATSLAAAAGQIVLRLYQRAYLEFQFESFGSLLANALIPALVAAGLVSTATILLDRSRRKRRAGRYY